MLTFVSFTRSPIVGANDLVSVARVDRPIDSMRAHFGKGLNLEIIEGPESGRRLEKQVESY
jgi:hypothetical protein